MAIKISGSTIIDDSRVVVNADKIGIGTPSPNRDLEILSTNATGIGVSAASAQSTDLNKAISVYNAGVTTTFAVSYTGIVTASEYFGTFKGNIDPGVPITNAGKIQIHHNSTNDFFNVPFFNRGLTNDTFQDIQYDSTNSLEYNPSLGNLRINSGAGVTGLILRTTNNSFDRAISFQNSGGNYVGYLGMENIGSDDADMVFGVDFTNESVATNVTERLRITNAGITSVKGEDDQDNFIVDVSGTQFAVHTDATDGEISLRAQDGTPNNFSKFMTFFTQASGSAASERLRITSDGIVGIGTDDPSGAQKLNVYTDSNGTGGIIQITQDGTGDAAIDFQLKGTREYSLGIDNSDSDKFKLSSTAGLDSNTLLTVTTGGSVGIGTAAPDAPLHVFHSTTNNIALFESGDAFAAMGISDVNGSVNFLTTLGGLRIGVNGDAGTLGTNSSLAMTIKNNGNVGIVTDNPGAKLHIGPQNGDSTHHVYLASGNNDYGFLIDVQDYGAQNVPLRIFNRRNNNDTEVIRVTQGGDVGIGTESPTAPLHILRRVADTVGVTTLLTLHSTRNDMTPSSVSGGSLRFLNDDGNNSGEAFIQANTPSSYNPANEGNRERTVDFNFIQENAGTLNTNFTIKGQGNVGINQSDPQTLLDIHTTTEGEVVRLRASDNTRYLKISSFNAEFNGSGYDFDATSSGGAFSFSITGNEKLRITKDGDLLRGGTGQDIGSASAPWDKVYANEFIGEINTTQENITTGDLLVTGIATFQGSVSIAGTLTYEDVTNVDAIGLVTARNGIHVTGGNVGIGTDNPLSLLSLYSDADGEELLHFDMGSPDPTLRRGWRFQQKDDGTATKLNLKSISNGKSFLISDSSNNVTFQVNTSSTDGIAHNGAYIYMYPLVAIGQTLAHINDTDTKLEFPADNTIKFDTAGTERLRITSSGAVGINTTVDATTQLQVQTDATSTTAGGNVVARFQSNGSGRDATIQLSDNVANSATISMLSSALILKQSGTETVHIESDGNVRISDQHLRFDTTGKGIIFGINGGSDRPSIIGNYTSSTDNNIVFNTTGNEKVRIDKDGNVGIKNDSPASQLDGAKDLVIGNTSEADTGITLVSTTAGQGLIHFSDATSGNARYDGFIGYEQTGRFLKFGTAQALKLKIDSDGNLLRGGTGQDIGASGAPWDKVYANEFIGLVNTTQENITTGNLLVTGISTFVGVATFHAVGIGTDSVDSAKLEINVGSAVTALDIQGSEGQLFSVTNNLTTGSIFAVNDVSGTPSINVDADGTIQLAPFLASDKIGIGTTNPASKLHVSGKATFEGELEIYQNGVDRVVESPDALTLKSATQTKVNASSFNIKNIANNKSAAFFQAGGAVKLSYDDNVVLETATVSAVGDGVRFPHHAFFDDDIGVGTDEPHCRLDVRNASGTDPLVELHHSDYNVLGEVIRIGRVDDDAIRYHSIKAKHHATASSNQLQIFMHDGTGSPAIGQTEAVRIRGDGKIGIGTDSISQRLVVEDSLQLRSALYNTILFFQRTDTNANGWIGIPNWNPDALYIFGPTTSGNEVAAAYSQAKWTFSTGGNTALTIKDGSVNIGGDYDQTTRKLKITGDVEVTSGTLFANISGTITPSGDVDISGDLTVSGQIGIGTDNANRPLDVFGNAQIGTKSTADAELVIGRDGSGNRNAYIDFIGDNTYTDYGLRMIRKNDNNGANAESQIAHRGTGNLSIVTNEAADIVLATNSLERVRINDDGRIQIGTLTNNPIVLTASDEEAIQITADIRNSNADQVYGIRVDVDDDPDSVTVTGIRERGSAYFRIDGNSQQGDTSNQLRIQNIVSDVNCNEDYDNVRGIFSDVNTNHESGAGTISNSYAVYGDARHEDDGAISNIYGGFFFGRANGSGATGAIGNLYGIRAVARHAGSNTGNTGNMIGVKGEVQIREGTATRRTAGNVYSFHADLHNDNISTPSTVVTGRKAMYFGDVSGTTNVSGLGQIYGLYLQDATDNYLSGNLQVVGVATVATLNATTINATTITGTVSGAAERITLTNQSGDDTCNIVFAQSATGNQLPHTNANLTFNATTGQVGASLLRVTGGTFANTGAGAETNPTNVAMMVDEGDYIYTHDSTTLKRRLLGKTTTNIIELGHSNTAHIGEIRMLPGTGFFSVYQGSNEKFRVQSDALNFKTPIRYGSDTSTLLTSHVYVRGTAHTQATGVSRVITLNGEDIIPNNPTGRGLVLVILTTDVSAGSGISTVSVTAYDTHTGSTGANNLATAITGMNRDKIGILASYDACMGGVNDTLRTAAQKVGLFKLAGITGGHTGNQSRLPYAAIFRGTSDDTNAEVNDAIEVMHAYSGGASPPSAVITTHLASFGTTGRDAGISGAYSVSAIVSPSGSTEQPLLQGKSGGNVEELTITADLIPEPDASGMDGIDLGDSSNYFRHLYVRSINADTIVGGLQGSGSVDIDGDLDVDGHTDLDNVDIAGVTTFASDIKVDFIRSVQFSNNSFLDFDDDSVPPHMSGTNVTSLKSISGLNLVFDTNNNDSNGLIIGSGNATSANMNIHMVVTAGGDVGIGTINPTGGNALTNNTSTLAVGTLKANTISGTVSGAISDVVVTQEGRSAPCYLPITVTGTTTKTIGIATESNAFGAKYVQVTEPTGSSICDGDIWYDTSGEQQEDNTSEIVEATKFFQNPTSLTQTTTFPVSGTKNGGVFGPYTIAGGVTLTISSGSTFTIL